MRIVLFLIIFAALAGCTTKHVDPNHDASLKAFERGQQQQAMQLASIADASACNGDPTCVVAAKAMAAMAAQAGASQGRVPQYVRQPGAAERVTLGLLGALPGLAQVYATIDAGRRNVDIARINADREIGMADAWAGVTGDVAAAFGALPPSTYVGGDLISGTQHIGDAVGGDLISGTQTVVGRDQIGGDQHIGDWRTGDDVRRDTIGGDRVDFGSGNRLDSPGPYSDVGNDGQRCTGPNCQTILPPESEG